MFNLKIKTMEKKTVFLIYEEYKNFGRPRNVQSKMLASCLKNAFSLVYSKRKSREMKCSCEETCV